MSLMDSQTSAALLNPVTGVSGPPAHVMKDKFGRTITDLRVSITDRCNYKCVYCRTGTDGAQFAELAMEDYLRMIRIFVGLGIQKVRLTGGEPLLRKDIISLVAQLAELRTNGSGNPLDIAITTNGHLLAEMAAPLARSGLSRITVSMDAVDPAIFARITRFPAALKRYWPGCEPPSVPGWVRSRSTVCCCEASTMTRSSPSRNSRERKA